MRPAWWCKKTPASCLFSRATFMLHQGKLFHHLNFKVGCSVFWHTGASANLVLLVFTEICISHFIIFSSRHASPLFTSAGLMYWGELLSALYCWTTMLLWCWIPSKKKIPYSQEMFLFSKHLLWKFPWAHWEPAGASFQWLAVDNYGTIGSVQM